jgi:ribosome assembly protein YihI (activator of Der GTPase)
VESARRKKKRKTQDYMAKHSEDGSRTLREELAGNKSSGQEQDPMASFHKGPMPLQVVKGYTTTTTTTTCGSPGAAKRHTGYRSLNTPSSFPWKLYGVNCWKSVLK